jgi:mono/diheme cytochrome c family protein
MPNPRAVRSLLSAAAAVLLAGPSLATVAAAEPPAKLFARSCSPCHGKSGQPSPVFAKQGVRDFTLSSWQKAITDAQIEKSIREGKKGTMMAGFGQLSADEIKGLTRFIRSLERK